MQQFNVNRFRRGRGLRLAAFVDSLAADLGRPVQVLDIGGRAEYWNNLPECAIARISITNLEASELDLSTAPRWLTFDSLVCDATAMPQFADGQFDLVHSNSVIEHVSAFDRILAMAAECRRVGRAGWIQTPAYEFPIDPHFRLPFIHWLGAASRARYMTVRRHYRLKPLAERRIYCDWINMMTRREFASVFPGCDLWTERLILPKSYVATWRAARPRASAL